VEIEPTPVHALRDAYSRPAPKLTILLPVRNEGVNLKIMLKILPAVVEVPHEILVVYDFSEDDSVPVIEAMQADYPNLFGVQNTLGRGVINALRAGVKAAKGEYVLTFVADEVAPVLAIEPMLKLMDSGCDFVGCTRYAYGGRRLGGSVIGGILSRSANLLFHYVAGSVLTDCTTGVKMFRRHVFDMLDLQSKPVGWAVAFEMAIKAELAGLRLGEVPVISIDRLYGGNSTFRIGPWIREYSRWFFWGMRRLRSSSQRPRARIVAPAVGR
jgi:dolichol-phosphate mannosyltransferase